MAIRRKRFSKVGINQSLIIDTAIASLIVQLGPSLINQLLFSSNPLTGMTASLAGVGGAYLYGMLMNNSNVSNIGIALGAVEVIKPTISSLLTSAGMGDYGSLNEGKYFNLSEYTNDPSSRLTKAQYSDAY